MKKKLFKGVALACAFALTVSIMPATMSMNKVKAAKSYVLADAQKVLKTALKITDAVDAESFDLDGDGSVTLADAQMVLKYALKIEETPKEENPDNTSNYTMLDFEILDAAGTAYEGFVGKDLGDIYLYEDEDRIKLIANELFPDIAVSAYYEETIENVLGTDSETMDQELSDLMEYMEAYLPKLKDSMLEDGTMTVLEDVTQVAVVNTPQDCTTYAVSMGALEIKDLVKDCCDYLTEYDSESDLAMDAELLSEIPELITEDLELDIYACFYISSEEELLGVDFSFNEAFSVSARMKAEDSKNAVALELEVPESEDSDEVHINIQGYITTGTIKNSEIPKVSKDYNLNAATEHHMNSIVDNAKSSALLQEVFADDAEALEDFALGIVESVESAAATVSAIAEAEAQTNAYFTDLGFEVGTKEVLGFPGADGFGKYTVGGRGGRIIEVTNLNDSGPGSLRAAIDAEGPRIVVFKVCGTIELQSLLRINNPYITIAGQTAPGDGICLANYGLYVNADQVIVRYLRSRPGDLAEEGDSIWVNGSKNVILDHLSSSWGTDETLSVSDSDDVSVQWCLISESLNQSINAKGTHGMGSLIRGSNGQKVTFHHNMYFSHRNRSPMQGNYTPYTEDPVGFNVEFINNVVYNWSGMAASKNHDEDSITKYNYIGNYYRSGRKSQGTYMFSEECPYTEMYASGNSMNDVIPADQRTMFEFSEEKPVDQEKYFQAEPFDFSIMSDISTAQETLKDVIAGVGASASRDAIDTAVIKAFEIGGGKLIDCPDESVGHDKSWGSYWPPLEEFEPYEDTDGDGMSDEWEEASGLDPEDATDGAKVNKSNYTNLDVFLEYLVQNPEKAYMN